MNLSTKIQETIDDLKSCSADFSVCFNLLQKEEMKHNRLKIMECWGGVLDGFIDNANEQLTQLKEGILWSMVDDRRKEFSDISATFKPNLERYAEYKQGEAKKIIQSIIFMLDEAKGGFRQSHLGEDYYNNVFNNNLERYRKENEERLEMIYSQDDSDLAFAHPDENERKNFMVDKRRDELFKTKYGKEYHETGRNIAVLVSCIFDKKDKEDTEVIAFLDKYLALQIAERHLRLKKEPVFTNIIFKENVDVDKVIRKLGDFLEDKTISAQKHWFIVHKVFSTKKWLATKTQEKFRDQIMAAFSKRLKCSKEDFKKVDTYFKDKDYKNWTMHDPTAPPCCDEYRKIALALDTEFQDVKYAKPGKCITTKNPEKFR